MRTDRISNCQEDISPNSSQKLVKEEEYSNMNASTINLLSEYSEDLSSDGDSVSSPSISIDSYGSGDKNISSISSTKHHLLYNDESKGAYYLRNAGIFTREEVISQAIGRWSEYIRLCGRSLGLLRDCMVDRYIKHAVDAKVSVEKLGLRRLVSHGSQSASVTKTCPVSYRFESNDSSRNFPSESRELRRFRRHSSRVENRKRLALLSKFAFISNNLAPWQASSQKQICKYRDPTITTREYRCTRTCIPLTPYCAKHLVLISSTDTIDDASSRTESSLYGQSPCPVGDLESLPLLPRDYSVSIRENKVCLKRKMVEPLKVSEKVSMNTEGYQFPRQFLFRKCGGGPLADCTKPVIAWSPSSRCCYHHSVDSLWQELDCTSQSSHSHPSGIVTHHPSLVNLIRRFKDRESERKSKKVECDYESL